MEKLNTKKFVSSTSNGITPFDNRDEFLKTRHEETINLYNTKEYRDLIIENVKRKKHADYMRKYYESNPEAKERKRISCLKRLRELANDPNYKARRKKYYEEHRDHILTYHKNFYEENKEIIREKQQEYNLKNSEEIKAAKRQYYDEHREHILRYHDEYRLKNAELLKEKFKERYHKNREKILKEERDERKTKFEALVNDPQFGGVCKFCGKKVSSDAENVRDKPEFHHTIPEKKTSTMYTLVAKRSPREVIQREIDNGGVVLLCYDCHRKFHAKAQSLSDKIVDEAVKYKFKHPDISFGQLGKMFDTTGKTLLVHFRKRGLLE